MPEEFSWSFELVDKVTASATRMERSLVNIEQALKRAQGSARAGTGSWAMFGIKMGAVAGIASAVTRELIDLGGQVLKMGATGAKWALEAGSFNENTQLSLEAILGSASAAQRALSVWGRLAENTPFDVRNVIEWGKQLTVAGESVENTVTVLKGVSDVAAKLGSTPEKQRQIAEQTIDMFSRIKQLGSEASVRNLREFANLGISPGMIEKNLANRLTGGNIAALRKGMETARQTGQDMSHEIILAALQAIQDMGGKLGTTGAKAAATLSSLFTRLQQRVQFDIFKGIEKTAGYRAIESMLRNINETLNPKSATGAAIMGAMRDLGNTLGAALKPLTGPEGRKRMEEFFRSMIDLAKQLVPLMADAARYTEIMVGAVAGRRAATAPTSVGEEMTQLKEWLFGKPAIEPSRGVPAMLAAPTIHMTNTVHVHGNADASTIPDALRAASQDIISDMLERVSLLAGAQ